MGLSDIELAKALGISLGLLMVALNEAGLSRCPEKATAQQPMDREDTSRASD